MSEQVDTGSEQSARPKGRWAKRARWALVVVVVLACLLVVGLWQGVPLVAKHVVAPRISEKLNGELTIAKASFNPFTLRLELEGVEVVDDAGGQVASVAGIVADVEWATVWRLALCLSEVTVSEPTLAVEVSDDGKLSLLRLIQPMLPGGGAKQGNKQGGGASAASAGGSGGEVVVPELYVKAFRVDDAKLGFATGITGTMFDQTFGPIDLAVDDLSTAAGDRNAYVFEVVTPGDGKVEGTGEFDLYALNASGKVTVSAADVPVYDAFLRRPLGFSLESGKLAITVGYDLSLLGGQPTLTSEVEQIVFDEVSARAYDLDEPFYVLDTLTLTGISLEVESDESVLAVERIDVGTGEFVIERIPGQLPPMQETLKILLHSGFAELKQRIAEGMQLEQVAGSPVASGVAATQPMAKTGQASETPAKAMAQNVESDERVINLRKVRSGVGQLVLSAVGAWNLSVDEIVVGAQVSHMHDERFIALESALLQGVATHTQPLALTVASVELEKPSADLVLTDGGELLVIGQAQERVSTARENTGEVEPLLVLDAAETEEVVTLRIDQAVIRDGYVVVEDRGGDSPVRLVIEDIQGKVTGFGSHSPTPAEAELLAKFDQGAVKVVGEVNPLGDPMTLDVETGVSRVAMTPFSKYAGQFLGYKIDRGTVDAVAEVLVDGDALDIQNKIVLNDFYLGEKVDSDQALNVPVKLGLDLLRDNQGVIEIEIPVTGDLSDPQLDPSKVIEKAIGNVVGKAASAPFEFIAGAFGGKDEASGETLDVGRIGFAPGEVGLDAIAVQKVGVLARALMERPGITFEVIGQYDEAVDGDALRGLVLQTRVDEVAIASREQASDKPVTESERQEALKTLYYEAFDSLPMDSPSEADRSVVLQDATSGEETTAQTDQANGSVEGEPTGELEMSSEVKAPEDARRMVVGRGPRAMHTRVQVDKSKPAKQHEEVTGLMESNDAMWAALLETVSLPEGKLDALAQARAANVIAAIQAEDTSLDSSRLVVAATKAGEAVVQMGVK